MTLDYFSFYLGVGSTLIGAIVAITFWKIINHDKKEGGK